MVSWQQAAPAIALFLMVSMIFWTSRRKYLQGLSCRGLTDGHIRHLSSLLAEKFHLIECNKRRGVIVEDRKGRAEIRMSLRATTVIIEVIRREPQSSPLGHIRITHPARRLFVEPGPVTNPLSWVPQLFGWRKYEIEGTRFRARFESRIEDDAIVKVCGKLLFLVADNRVGDWELSEFQLQKNKATLFLKTKRDSRVECGRGYKDRLNEYLSALIEVLPYIMNATKCAYEDIGKIREIGVVPCCPYR